MCTHSPSKTKWKKREKRNALIPFRCEKRNDWKKRNDERMWKHSPSEKKWEKNQGNAFIPFESRWKHSPSIKKKCKGMHSFPFSLLWKPKGKINVYVTSETTRKWKQQMCLLNSNVMQNKGEYTNKLTRIWWGVVKWICWYVKVLEQHSCYIMTLLFWPS